MFYSLQFIKVIGKEDKSNAPDGALDVRGRADSATEEIACCSWFL
jgi:hypothetical protein